MALKFVNDPLLGNPWNVGSLEDFLVYSCPECLTFERTKNAFVEHATNEHPSSHELMFSLGLFDPGPSDKKEALDENESFEFVTDGVGVIDQPVTPLTPNNPEQHPIQLQNEFMLQSQINTEQHQEESKPPLPLLNIERVLNVSEHETSSELRGVSDIFFKKLVPAKANIQAKIWENRTKIPLGPKENVMYVMKNFNKDRTTGRYKNPSCDYGPWKCLTHNNQYKIQGKSLKWMGESDHLDFGLADHEKLVIKTSRCYLKADRKYVKMVTYVKQCPEEYISSKDFCVVEYVGTDIYGPNTNPHRNSKSDSMAMKAVQPIQLQNELIDQVKTEPEEEYNPISSLSLTDRVLNVSEHETSTVLRAPSVIFFQKLVPAKANIQDNIWENRTEIPFGPKENVMYVLKNFNKDRTGRYKNPSCDYGPWCCKTHTNQYVIKGNALQWIGQSENKDFGINDHEKVVLKTSRCNLQANPKYTKMITYVRQCPEDYISTKDYCVVEYVGTDLFGPNTIPHGNSKSGNPYKRNNPYIMEEAKDIIKKGKLNIQEVLSELSDSSIGQTLPSAKAISGLKNELLKAKGNETEQELISDQIKIEPDDLSNH